MPRKGKTSESKQSLESDYKQKYLNAMISLEEVKSASKVNAIQLMHDKNIKQYTEIYIKMVSSSLELIETCELCLFYIANQSPNVKLAIRFIINVLNRHNKRTEKYKSTFHGASLQTVKHQAKSIENLIKHLSALSKKI
jgi:hypothetical protein